PREAPIETPAEIATKAAISVVEGTSPRKMNPSTAASTGTSATNALERSAPSREMAWFKATNEMQPISTPCQSTCHHSSSGATRHIGAGADQRYQGTTIRAE